MSKQRNHSITYSDLNEVIDVLIDDRTALKRGIMQLIDQAFKEGKTPPKTIKGSKHQDFLRNAIKSCKYPCDIESMSISVPMGKEDDAMDDLTISYLVNTLKFNIQSCITDQVQERELFNPTFREKQQTTPDTSVILPKRGEVWLNKGERWYIKQVTDVAFTITILESMKSDIKRSHEEIQLLISEGMRMEVKK